MWVWLGKSKSLIWCDFGVETDGRKRLFVTMGRSKAGFCHDGRVE